jgi:hypothetical protein
VPNMESLGRRDAGRRFSYLVSLGSPRSIDARCDILWRRRDNLRLFSNVVSNVIPRLTYAKYGVFLRRRDDWLPDAGRWFSQLLHTAFRDFCWFHLCFGVVVVTIGLDLAASLLVPSLSSYTLYMESFVGVSTLGVGL